METAEPDDEPEVVNFRLRHEPIRRTARALGRAVVSPGRGGCFLVEYERQEPEKTLLHEVIREQLEPFLARAKGQGAPVAICPRAA
jgi:hypothetical protein